MAAGKRCGPPQTVRVKGYSYLRGAPKKKRKRKAAPAVPHWVCVQQGTGRSCGSKHRKLTGALAHIKKLDKAARAYRARHGKGTPLRLWNATPRNFPKKGG